MSGISGGGAGNVAYGGTVNPPRYRKGGAGNPPPTGARTSALPNGGKFDRHQVAAVRERGLPLWSPPRRCRTGLPRSPRPVQLLLRRPSEHEDLSRAVGLKLERITEPAATGEWEGPASGPAIDAGIAAHLRPWGSGESARSVVKTHLLVLGGRSAAVRRSARRRCRRRRRSSAPLTELALQLPQRALRVRDADGDHDARGRRRWYLPDNDATTALQQRCFEFT